MEGGRIHDQSNKVHWKALVSKTPLYCWSQRKGGGGGVIVSGRRGEGELIEDRVKI